MKVKVDIDELNSAAAKLENAHQNYASELNKLIQNIESIKSFWQGKDSAILIERALALGPNLHKLEKLISMYADFLRDAALKYDEVDMDIYRRICNI